MASSDYWRKREEEALKHYIKQEAEYDKEIKRIYQSQLDAIQKEIDSFYGRYASKEGITLAEAKKRVSKADVEAYGRKAARYVKDKDFSARANEEMRLYNLTMKVNRLEMLKANIGLELIAGHEELDKFMGGILRGRTEEELKRQAGILGKTVRNNAQKANAILNASFRNATFSDRIWMYQGAMKAELSKLLQSGLIQGKNPRALARELQKHFNVSTANAERLMRTELARVQTEAQKQSYIANGVESYKFLANSGCCDICQSLDGKYFKVKDMMPGENASPMHPNCRCSTVEDNRDLRRELDAELDFIAAGGSAAEWNNRIKISSPGSTKSYKRSLEDIAAGKAGLDKRRQNMLNRLRNTGDSIRLKRGSVSTRDLAYLSASTGNEFALFRNKNDDILIRGNSRACDVAGDLGDEIISKKYEWAAHSHVDRGTLMPSIADRTTLKRLNQKSSILVGIDGEEIVFHQSVFDD